MHHDKSDLGSLAVIWIIPRERTLSVTVFVCLYCHVSFMIMDTLSLNLKTSFSGSWVRVTDPVTTVLYRMKIALPVTWLNRVWGYRPNSPWLVCFSTFFMFYQPKLKASTNRVLNWLSFFSYIKNSPIRTWADWTVKNGNQWFCQKYTKKKCKN